MEVPAPLWADSPDRPEHATWMSDVHGSVSTGRPVTHRGSTSRPAWRNELYDPEVDHSTGWSISGSGVTGKVARVTGPKNDRATGFSASMDRTDTQVGFYQDHGTATNGSTRAVAWGQEGAQASWSDRATTDSGTLARNASISAGNNGLLARAGQTHSTTAAGHTLADPTQSLTSHRAAGAATQRTTSLGASASAKADIRPSTPYVEGDHVVVPYTMVVSSTTLASAGLSSAALESGGTKDIGGLSGMQTGDSASVAAAIGRSGTAELTGVKHFPTMDHAKAWYQTPVPDGTELAFLDPSLALGLDEGERSGGALSLEASATLSASGMGPTVSAGLSAGVGAGLSMERLHGGWVRLTRNLQGQVGGALSVGAPGLDIGGQKTAGMRGEQTWKLDLHTPEGSAAYTQIMLCQTPEDARGVQRESSASSSTDANTVNVNAAALGYAVGDTGLDREVTRPDGTYQITEEGRKTQRVSAHRSLQFAVPSVDADQGMLARTEYAADGTEKGTGILVIGRTQSNSAKQNAEAIGRAAGVDDYAHPGRDQGTPGQWTIDTDYGPNSLARLAKAAQDYDLDGLRHITPAPQVQFIEALRAAGTNTAAQRQAIQDLGRSALDHNTIVRSLLHHHDRRPPTSESYLGLSGSGTWIGIAGFEAVERAVADARDDFSHGKYGAQAKLLQDKVEHQNRLLDLQNKGLYPEVPDSLRQDEIDRTEGLIRQIDATLQSVPDEHRLASPLDGDSEFAEQFRILEGRCAAMEAVYEVLLDEWERHKIDHGTGGIHKTPYEQLGDQNMFIMMIDGPESERYREAKAMRDRGEQQSRRAKDAYARLRDDAAQAVEDVRTQSFVKATAAFDRATRLLTSSASILVRIRTANPEVTW